MQIVAESRSLGVGPVAFSPISTKENKVLPLYSLICSVCLHRKKDTINKLLQMPKSQRRNKSNMKSQDHIFTPKVTNPMVMNPRKNSLESLPDKEFKRMIITLFK